MSDPSEDIANRTISELVKNTQVDSNSITKEVSEDILNQARLQIFKDVQVGGDLITGDIIQKIGLKIVLPLPPPPPTGIPQNLPYSSTDRFVGRAFDLEHLHHLLQDSERVAITAITGMGGIGKTELALQYALRYQDSYPGGLCWLQVRGADLGSQIVNFGRSLLSLNPPDDLDLRGQVAFCWGHWPNGEVLVVLDDVNDYPKVKPYLPLQPSRFKVLITTRLQLVDLPQSLTLDVLGEQAALNLLQQWVGSEKIDQQLADAKEICQRLGYLPLALNLVGRYVKKRKISLAEMLRRLEEKGLQHQALDVDKNKRTWTLNIQQGVATAFELSWEELSDNAKYLGCLLSLFALAPIPWELVEKIDVDVCQENEELEDARVELEDLHLLQGEKTYSQHQLVREFFQGKLAQLEEADEYRRSFCKAMVDKAQKFPNPPTLEEIEAFAPAIPHLAEVTHALTDWLEHEDFPWPFVGLGRFYKSQGAYDQAELWWKSCVDKTKKYLGDNHPDVASSLNNLAAIYVYQGRYQEAESRYQEALELWDCQPIRCHLDEATTLNNLAALYCEQGRYEKAKSLYEQALKLSNLLLPNNHPDVANSLNNLAAFYYAQGRYQEAEPLYQKALKLRKQVQEKQHPEVAQSLNNLAVLYRKCGRYAEAERLYLEAKQLWEQVVGENHPFIATLLNNLAALYCELGNYQKAESSYIQALEIITNSIGEENPDVIVSLINLAKVYYSQDRYQEAENRYLEALELSKKCLENSHPYIVYIRLNLAEIYRVQKRYREAESLYQELLKLREKIGKSKPEMISLVNNLALLYYSQKHHQKAEELYLEAIELWEKYEKLSGEKNLKVVQTINNLAQLYLSEEEYKKAESMYLKALEIQKNKLGENHLDTISTQKKLANINIYQGKNKEAAIPDRKFQNSEDDKDLKTRS